MLTVYNRNCADCIRLVWVKKYKKLKQEDNKYIQMKSKQIHFQPWVSRQKEKCGISCSIVESVPGMLQPGGVAAIQPQNV